MTKKVLDVTNVNALLQKKGREGVTKHVGGNALAEIRVLRKLANHGSDGLL